MRKADRFSCSGLFEISEQCEERIVYRGAALARDLSETGVCLQMDVDATLGSTLILKNRLAEVRAVVRNSNRVEQGFLVGVEFLDGFKWSLAVPGPFQVDSGAKQTPIPISTVGLPPAYPPSPAPIKRSRLVVTLLGQIQEVHNRIKTTLGVGHPAADSSSMGSTRASGQASSNPLGLLLFEDAPTQAIVLDSDLNIKFANNAFIRVFGSISLLTSRAFGQFVVPEDLPRVNECARNTMRCPGIKTLEFRVLDVDGKTLLLSSQWKYLKAAHQTLIHLSDITHNRLEEGELLALVCQSKPGLKTAGIAGWTWDLESGTIQCSREYILLYGLDPGTVTLDRATWDATRHPEDRDRIDREIEMAITVTGHICMEFRIIRPDGSVVWLAASGHVNYAGGKPVSISGHTTDISDRKIAEASVKRVVTQLELSNAALGTALAYLPLGTLIVESANGGVMASNDPLDRIFGGKDKARSYQAWSAVDMSGKDYPLDRHPLMRSLSTGEIVTNEPMCIYRVDGTLVAVIVSSMPIHNDEGKVQGAITTMKEDDSETRECPVVWPRAGAAL